MSILEELLGFADAVRRMREAQEAYSRNRNPAFLAEAKKQAVAVDKVVVEIEAEYDPDGFYSGRKTKQGRLL